MIKHIFKMVWNRKKRMSLVLIEIFLSFVVAFIAFDMLVSSIRDYIKPLGFDYTNILDVHLYKAGVAPFHKLSKEDADQYRAILQEIKSFPQVEAASYLLGDTPYGNMRIGTSLEYKGITSHPGMNYTDDDFLETMKLQLVEGRWFNSEDFGSLDQPMVIDELTKRELFGDQSAVGQKLKDPTSKKQEQLGTKYNIVGVVKTFRPMGEFQRALGEVFIRQTWDDSSYIPYTAMVKVREGTDVSFELEMQRRLTSVAPTFTFRIQPLADNREVKLRDAAINLILPLIISLFLLFNVMLGLFGIFWQSINKRRGEIGLRRAVGGNSRTIQFHIFGESMAIGTLAILAGIPVVINLAVLGISKPFGSPEFFLSFVCAGVLIYIILLVCAIYPSYLATRIRPAEALHNE